MCLLPVIQTCSSTDELCSKTTNVFERLRKIPWSLFFKAGLCQQADPHTVWSSTVLISTQPFGLVGLKIWAQVCVFLSWCWCNYHHRAWERLFCLLLSSLYSPVTLQCTPSVFVEGYPCRGAKLDLWLGVIHCGSCDSHSLDGSKGTVALALLQPYCLHQIPWAPLACPAQPTLRSQVLLPPRLGLSLHTQRLLSSLQHGVLRR